MRHFINVSWNNSSAVYDGSQQMNHFRKNGSAAIENYADPEPVKKAKKVKAPDYRTLDQKREDTLDRKRVQFERAFENGEISFEQYNLLLTEWEKAMARLEKRMGVVKDENLANEPTPIAKRSIINTLENAANSFRAKHPFAFTVVGCLFGCGLLNLVGFGG